MCIRDRAKDKLQTIVRTDPDDSVAEAAKAALQKMGAEVPKRDVKPLPGPAELGIPPVGAAPTTP